MCGTQEEKAWDQNPSWGSLKKNVDLNFPSTTDHKCEDKVLKSHLTPFSLYLAVLTKNKFVDILTPFLSQIELKLKLKQAGKQNHTGKL